MRANILFVLLLTFTISAFAAPRHPSPWERGEPGFARIHLRDTRALALDEDSLHFYDAIKFSPYLNLDFTSHIISGYVLINLTTHESALDRIDFRFTHSLTIDSVWAGNYSATLTSDGNDSIQVMLSPSLQPNDTITIGISYHGNPAIIDSWGGYRWADANSWRPEIAWTMGDGLDIDPPPANYSWIPSYADPNDKAEWDAWFRVPTGKTVSTNGLRMDTTNNGDNTTTWHHRLDQPISTYLQFISASDYLIQVQRESGPRIENFVYPSRWSQAQVHFSNVPTVLDSFVSRFGPFPFARMGYNMTRTQGDMEHATNVSHWDAAVNANHTYDWLLFHEMSHMWWGDWVTCGDWRDLWLNEGFATFCEALSMETLGGYNAYLNYVVNDLFPAARNATDSYSIYDPDYYWGATVYEKGACVMHMLRCLLGDSSFFAALQEYGQEHAFGTAVTDDWQAKLEEHYGESLDWFFQPWIYGTRYPQYEITTYDDGSPTFSIIQAQPWETRFRMPLEIRWHLSDHDTTIAYWTDSTNIGEIPLPPGAQLDGVADPDHKILCTTEWYFWIKADHPPSGLPERFAIASIYPNPFNPATTITIALPQTSPVHLRVFNLLGREVEHTDLGWMNAGNHSVPFDGSRLPSGVYLFRVESNLGTRFTKAVLLK